MSDQEFTALIRSLSTAGTRRGWRCPDEGLLAAWVERRLPAESSERLESHLADCPFCCGQVGFLAREADLGPPPTVPVHLVAQARGARLPRLGGLHPATFAAATAALILMLVVGTPLGRHYLPSSPDSIESGIGAALGSGDELQVRTARDPRGTPWILRPSEGESVTRAALEFQWEGAPETLFYTVQIVDPSGDVVWEGRAEGTRLAIPPEAALSPGQPYFAWVMSHLRSGATVRSPAVGFRLAPG